MSELAKKLLEDIQKEYQNRLDEGKSPQCNAFSKELFITKYNYSEKVLNELLDELKYFGYITKWITGDFTLIID